jgi:hypothetical protein
MDWFDPRLITTNYFAEGGEVVIARQGDKLSKFCIGDFWFKEEEFIKIVNGLEYPKDCAKLTSVLDFHYLTDEEKQLAVQANERLNKCYMAYQVDFIPQTASKWDKNFLVQILNLFKVMIKNGVFIGDISDQNWRVDNNGQLYLIDFSGMEQWEVFLKNGRTEGAFLTQFAAISYECIDSFGNGVFRILNDQCEFDFYSERVDHFGSNTIYDSRILSRFFPEPIWAVFDKFQHVDELGMEILMTTISEAMDFIQDKKCDSKNPSVLEVMRGVFSDYQNADVDEDFTLHPMDSSKSKWDIIEEASKIIKKDNFRFVDFGACYGLFSFKLAQTYPACSGVINNINDNEISCNNYVINIFKMRDRVSVQNCGWRFTEGKFDLLLCMSLIHHIVRGGLSLQGFYDAVNGMSNPGAVFVLEIPSVKDFAGDDVKLDVDEIVALFTNFQEVRRIKVDYDTGAIDRTAVVLVKD